MKTISTTLLLIATILLAGTTSTQAQTCCVMPVQTSVSNIMPHAAKLHWYYFTPGNCIDPTKFQVRYKPSNAANWITGTVLWPGNGNPFTFNATNLLSTNTYIWQVRTVCHLFGYKYLSPWTTLQTFTTLRVSNEEEAMNDIQLYPNPATTELYLQVPTQQGDAIQVRLLDVAGKSLSTSNFISEDENFSQPVDLTSLVNGMYLVEIKVNNESRVMRFVKE